ncbi:hypothetical protein PIROE2DRAFT_5332 [Piromyces sp. E2]|nr:hypothetical protein PIROE2DRAFT_5332 [Piromyces sp. E2]|eukprot:OUM67272.1 hypothetical protein PIROE2DRAFT_5332 [Piromyces sp. E2]
MHYTDSIYYCSQLSMSRESSSISRGSSPMTSPIVSPTSSPASSFLQISSSFTDTPKSPIDVIAKKRGASYQNLTISTSSIKSKSIYLRSPKVGSSTDIFESPFTESLPGSPCLNSSITQYSSVPQTPELSSNKVKKPFYMLPIFKPILVTNNNYISSSTSFFKIVCNNSKLHQNEFSFLPVNDKYEYIKDNNENIYSCHGVKFSKSKSILTNNKGATILYIKKKQIFNNNKEKICDIVYLNKLDEHFKIIVEITNKFDNDKVTLVCSCDTYNQTAFIYNNYPEKGGSVIGLISRINNFEKKINRGWVLEVSSKVDIPLIMVLSIFNIKNMAALISRF